MNTLFLILCLAAGVGVLTYLRASLLLGTVAGAFGLLALGVLAEGPLATLILICAWVVWAAVALLNLRAVRHRFVSAPALEIFRRTLPSISQTEQDALDAGTVWWDAELFSGEPDWQRLLSLPPERLTNDEQAFLDGPVETLCTMVNEWDISRAGQLSDDVWRYLRDEGFLGLIIPTAYGGKGFSARAHSRIVGKIASRSGTAAVSVMVPNSLGPAELLLHYGTEEQKQHYLPRLARGEEIPCFALTNPFAGSDAASIPDTGVVCRGEFDGQETIGIRVSWEKRYITLAPIATVLGLAFHLYDPERLLGGRQDVGITLALLPTTHPGVEIGRRHFPARQAFQNGPTAGRDVFIPLDWVIGGQARCGDGWRMLMNCLAAGRSISLPASSTAGLKVCARTTGAYARVRRQFNLPIGRFEGVQEAIARIVANVYFVDAARDVTAGALDAGEEPAVLSALLKYQSTERLRASISDAMDVHGGRAICDGPANYLMNAYTAAPVAITVEGANILTRSLIIFGQGAIRCHPWLLSEIDATKETHGGRAVETFDRVLFAHIGGVLTNVTRTFVKNVTGGLLGSDPSVGEVNYWYAQIERASATFATVSEVALMQLGGGLKRREMLSGRFADILGELYLMSCALKRFEDDGRPQQDLPVIEYAFRNAMVSIQRDLDDILAELPSRASAWLLRVVVFPWGRRWRPASDELTREVSDLLVNSGAFRERLCRDMYFDADANDPIGCLEHAAKLVEVSEAAHGRIQQALRDGTLSPLADDIVSAALAAGIVSELEAEQYRAAQQAVRRAIDVDDFAPGELWARAATPTAAADAA